MPREMLVPVRKFLRLLDYMGRIGLDPDAMVQALGLSQQELQRMPPDQRLPGTDYSRLYKDSVRQMETLKRPIPWAAGIGSEAHELMCHCIIGCKTLGEALDMAQRFDKLAYPLIAYRMHVKRTDSHFELHYKVRTEAEASVFVPENWDRAEYYDTVARASGLLVWFGFFTILITIAVTGWSTLQFWRFRGRDRRLESAVVSTEAEIGYWGIDRDQFEAIRNGQCQLVALDAQGRLLSVTDLSDR